MADWLAISGPATEARGFQRGLVNIVLQRARDFLADKSMRETQGISATCCCQRIDCTSVGPCCEPLFKGRRPGSSFRRSVYETVSFDPRCLQNLKYTSPSKLKGENAIKYHAYHAYHASRLAVPGHLSAVADYCWRYRLPQNFRFVSCAKRRQNSSFCIGEGPQSEIVGVCLLKARATDGPCMNRLSRHFHMN